MRIFPKSSKVRVLAIATCGLLALPAVALAWFFGQTGNSQMYFKDGAVAIGGGLGSVIQEASSTSGTRVVYAKTVVSSVSASVQKVKCRLDVIDTNTGGIVCSDWAHATLVPQSLVSTDSTLSMQCAQSATTAQINHAYFSRVSCSTSPGGGVTAVWSKITSVFQDNSPNFEVFIGAGN